MVKRVKTINFVAGLGLATLLKGAGYLFNIFRIQIYNIFNLNGKKCVLLAKNALKVLQLPQAFGFMIEVRRTAVLNPLINHTRRLGQFGLS